MVYGRHIFTGDMKSTQRCESMNSVLKRYLKSKHNLYRFYQHYERLLHDRRRIEAASEFSTKYCHINPSLSNRILNHAASVYTLTVFKVVQSEHLNLVTCVVVKVVQCFTTKICTIQVDQPNHSHTGKYDPSNNLLDCSWKEFNDMGILCCHAFRVLDHFHVIELPSQYILKRWTKEAKVACNKEGSIIDVDPNVALAKGNNKICFAFRRLASAAA